MLGHRQAFTWIDEWYGMSLADVRIFEGQMQKETNEKVVRPEDDSLEKNEKSNSSLPSEDPVASGPDSPKSPNKSWFSWS